MQPLVSAVGNYIPSWCGKILTPSGRTILANVVLGARAVYAMCSTLLLKGTIEAVDSQRRAFILGMLTAVAISAKQLGIWSAGIRSKEV
ncbi:unnamed protein product [Urochloa humidicola]